MCAPGGVTYLLRLTRVDKVTFTVRTVHGPMRSVYDNHTSTLTPDPLACCSWLSSKNDTFARILDVTYELWCEPIKNTVTWGSYHIVSLFHVKQSTNLKVLVNNS